MRSRRATDLRAGPLSFEGGVVASMSLPSGEHVVLAEQGAPRGVAVTDDRIYFADFSNGVYALGHADGTPLGAPQFFGGYTNAAGVWIHEETLFWTQKNLDNSIHRQALASLGPSVLIACHQEWPHAIVVDEHRTFWINQYIYEGAGDLMSLDRSADTPAVLVAGVVNPAPGSLTADETTLYWVERDRTIMRMRK